MKNATHRVIILKNCNSDIISQAIFFLKEDSTASQPKILAEAEKIVEKYMGERSSIPSQTSANTPINWKKTLNICGICAVSLCVFILSIMYFTR